jgi:hypothetical protein
MDIFKIREIIAESGKTTLKDINAYFASRYPTADKKLVTEQAKDLIAEMKKYKTNR